jgi:4-amino-4-deoxy-L-arabinose transferase-like glycosyltransferase
VPLLAAATQAFGHNLVLLRAIPAVLAAATVVFACLFARLAGGGRFAVAFAGITVATAPMFVGIGGTMNTSVFEPLAWTAVTYFVARAAVLNDRRALLWAGVTIGIALEAKYQIPFYIAPLVVAVLISSTRGVLFTREALGGAVIAVVLGIPSILWQWHHGFPFAELLKAAGQKNTVQPPVAFIGNQLFVMNPVFAPVWVAGVVASIVSPRFVKLRFVGIGFVLTFAFMMLLHAKDYYLAGLYASAFALGAVVFERFAAAVPARVAYIVAGLAFAVLGWVNALPLLDPPQYVRLVGVLPFLHPQEAEKAFHGQLLPQNLADQLGWPELARDVATVYNALPPNERAHAAILPSNYGEAGAIDFFGPAYGLPLAIAGHNQYYLWGPRGYDGSVIVRVNSDDPSWWRQHCREAHVAGSFGANPYVEPYEHNRPIIVCHGFFKPLPAAWDLFKNYE